MSGGRAETGRDTRLAVADVLEWVITVVVVVISKTCEVCKCCVSLAADLVCSTTTVLPGTTTQALLVIGIL